MKELEQAWNRLLALARRGWTAEEAAAVPPGLATRVVAHWMEIRRQGGTRSLWEWLAVRGLAVAVAVMVVSAIASWPDAPAEENAPEAMADLADPITPELLPPL